MNLSKLAEAKRLHALGFGVHWLRPASKVPVKSGWTEGEREALPSLVNSYQKGYNIGTKLGQPSKIGKKFLAVLDVDIKGKEKRHQKQARLWIKENFKGLLGKAPITLSGRGNGSMHIWCLVDSPFDSRKLTSSNEIIEVLMPSVKATPKMIEKLGKKKTDAGWRLRPAWEVDFMCAGRQVVLPPSIHPDTGKEYIWMREIDSVKDLPYLDINSVIEDMPEKEKNYSSGAGRPKGSKSDLKIEDVPLMRLEMCLSPELIDGIVDGENVEDRSSFCLKVAMNLVHERFTDAQILGVLTNREYFIGDVAFQHAKTSNRVRAARWAFDYCLRKARTEADINEIFKSEVKVYDTLSEKETKKQKKIVVSDLGQVDWKKKLDRDGHDKLKPTLKNIILILENSIAPNVFIRDEFANRDFYGCDTEWGGKKGESLSDDDCVVIKVWFAHKWKIEPTVNIVFEAMVSISSKNQIHPVRNYLLNLEWDGVPRINTWLKDCLNAQGDELYLQEVSRKFLVAAVARVFNPGVKFDQMLILEGKQGIGKSTVGNILAGDKWFLDGLPDLSDKDAALNLQGIWICEMGELAQLRRSDVEITKSFITRRIDKVRPPYGKRYIESLRQCVFFGTTNAEEYLKDKTGNRRFWPVKVGEVDFDLLSEIRDQLWAEALFYYDMVGENLWLEGDAKEEAESAQTSRVVEDEADIILDKIRMWWKRLEKNRRERAGQLGGKLPPMKFQTIELFEDFGDDENGVPPLNDIKSDNYKLQLASSALLKLGFRKVTLKGRKFWRLPTQKVMINQYK